MPQPFNLVSILTVDGGGTRTRYTNFELGTRVPLIIRAPQYSGSKGATTAGLAELVDIYPTLANLAGIPLDSMEAGLDGVSLIPFFEDPQRSRIPTNQGTLNKTVAFSQYPHVDNGALTPGTECPFFNNGTCHSTPITSITNKLQWMGFSMRDNEWRYTCWVPYNGTRALWDEETPVYQELYNHSYPQGTTSMDAIDEVENHAYDARQSDRVKIFYRLVRNFFDVLQPPTAPARGPSLPKSCKSWCSKFNHTQYCKWDQCKSCPTC